MFELVQPSCFLFVAIRIDAVSDTSGNSTHVVVGLEVSVRRYHMYQIIGRRRLQLSLGVQPRCRPHPGFSSFGLTQDFPKRPHCACRQSKFRS